MGKERGSQAKENGQRGPWGWRKSVVDPKSSETSGAYPKQGTDGCHHMCGLDPWPQHGIQFGEI